MAVLRLAAWLLLVVTRAGAFGVSSHEADVPKVPHVKPHDLEKMSKHLMNMCIVVNFYTPANRESQELSLTWDTVAQIYGEFTDVMIVKLLADRDEVRDQFEVVNVPTIKAWRDGNDPDVFSARLQLEPIVEWVNGVCDKQATIDRFVRKLPDLPPDEARGLANLNLARRQIAELNPAFADAILSIMIEREEAPGGLNPEPIWLSSAFALREMVRSINQGIDIRPLGSDPGADWARAVNRAVDLRYRAGETLFRDEVRFTVLAHLPFRTESERIALDTLFVLSRDWDWLGVGFAVVSKADGGYDPTPAEARVLTDLKIGCAAVGESLWRRMFHDRDTTPEEVYFVRPDGLVFWRGTMSMLQNQIVVEKAHALITRSPRSSGKYPVVNGTDRISMLKRAGIRVSEDGAITDGHPAPGPREKEL